MYLTKSNRRRVPAYLTLAMTFSLTSTFSVAADQVEYKARGKKAALEGRAAPVGVEVVDDILPVEPKLDEEPDTEVSEETWEEIQDNDTTRAKALIPGLTEKPLVKTLPYDNKYTLKGGADVIENKTQMTSDAVETARYAAANDGSDVSVEFDGHNMETVVVEFGKKDIFEIVEKAFVDRNIGEADKRNYTKIYVGVYPSADLPKIGSASENQVDSRTSDLKNALARLLPDADVASFNMATELSWIQKAVDTNLAIVTETARYQGQEFYADKDAQKMSGLGQIFRAKGGSDKAVIVIERNQRYAH